jgi:competence protein ComEC
MFTVALAVFLIALTRRMKLRPASLVLVVAFLLTGVLLSQIESRAIEPSRIARIYDAGWISSGDPVEVTAALLGEPEAAPQSLYLTLQVESIRFKGRERLASGTVILMARTREPDAVRGYEALQLHHGARIRVLTALDREENFRNPGVMPFSEYLERKGYDATGLIKSPLLIERLDDRKVFLPLAWLYQWRARLQREFSEKFSQDTAGVLNAALLGNSFNLSHGAAERFRAGGTFHILVISGMQIAFIAGLVLLIVRRMTKQKALQFVLASGFLWAYTIAVGAEASVTRAALMFTMAAFAPVVARKPASLNTIGSAALALLVWKPSDLFDPSFQLTFLSVLAIVCVAVPVLRTMQRVGSWRPTMVTPYPPQCSQRFRILSEVLYWREREWKAEIAASNIRYRLFKSKFAVLADRCRIQKLLQFAAAALIVSVSVQLVLLPAMILYFHRISIASLVLNIFVGGMMVILAFAALAAILLSHVSASLAAPLVMLAEKSNWLMVHLIDPFSRFGIASIRLPHYPGKWAIVYALYFLPLGFLIFRLSRWEPLRLSIAPRFSSLQMRLAMAALVFMLGLMMFHPFSVAKPDGQLHLDFLDVGQGDSALLTLPDGTTVLIDGGGQPNFDWKVQDAEDDEPFARDTRSIGERVVSEYLWYRGLDRVDYLIATHADADHIDGLNDVARNFRVHGAIVARTPSDDPEFRRFAESMTQTGIPVEMIGAGDLMRIGAVSFEVLWPPPASNSKAGSHNNDSIMLRVMMGEKSFLFTGDIEKKGEALVLAEGVNLHCDVVKVAHHGSRTSSIGPFVSATQPSLAVISVGRTSMFGHPHKEVVDRWRANGAQVMTTGEKGTISLVTDGRKLSVSTFVR